MNSENHQPIDYIFSFSIPVEMDFFKPDQLAAIENERTKYAKSSEFVASVIDKEDFEDRIQKAVVEGKIYNSSQMNKLQEKLDALESQSGVRVSSNESFVSPSGQRVIMSDRLADILGFYSDGYVLKDEIDDLVGALSSDGVPGPEVDKVVAAMGKYGAVVLQKGVFLVLKAIFEDAIGHSLSSYNKNAGFKPIQAVNVTPAQHIDELPFSFIEYLKNSDKEFDRVEHEVMNDPVFQEFFDGLRKQYAYYQNLSAERMAGEVMVRPQMWVKLSTQTRVWVQNIVTRNRDEFLAKVQQVAESVHLEKLDELKKSLG